MISAFASLLSHTESEGERDKEKPHKKLSTF